jgi:hypothetical protein
MSRWFGWLAGDMSEYSAMRGIVGGPFQIRRDNQRKAQFEPGH